MCVDMHLQQYNSQMALLLRKFKPRYYVLLGLGLGLIFKSEVKEKMNGFFFSEEYVRNIFLLSPIFCL